MFAAIPARSSIKLTTWLGWTISALAIAFLAFDTIIKVANHPMAVDATVQLGYPANTVMGIGLLQLACLVVYLIPRTSVLGAILMTGYLGGAVATHVRAESALFSLIFPVIVGSLVWGGLVLRNERLRRLIFQSASL